jgi:glutamyl-tRNA synthetase
VRPSAFLGLLYARAVRPDGRYAPSPTGPLHLGNLRTALLAWLFARSRGARFLLRVEDLDPQRSRPEHEAGQLADLAALGIDWDGPIVRQSDRAERYAAAVDSLRAQGLVYECFCTRAEIRQAASAPHGRDPLTGTDPDPLGRADPLARTGPDRVAHRPGATRAVAPHSAPYPGTCRTLSAGERSERLRAGRPPALRVRADGARVAFRDLCVGDVEGIVDDVVVRRNDGAYAYNLAVAVDDADQGVVEVVRGADLLDATAGQRWLAGRLALTPPASYAHVPLLRGDDGERLAKRHGAVTLAERLALGQTAADVRAELAASVGLHEPGERPSPAELVERFDAKRFARRVAATA